MPTSLGKIVESAMSVVQSPSDESGSGNHSGVFGASTNEFRSLGHTGLQLSTLSFGPHLWPGVSAPSISTRRSLRHVALDLGMNFIDTSPFYGRGLSECLLGSRSGASARPLLLARSSGVTAGPVRFSQGRVVESVDVSLQRLGVDHFDIMLCHTSSRGYVRVVEERSPP